MSKREQIAEAAFQVFAERGYAGARMDEVAERAGVAKGTLYLHFDSKKALFQAVIEHKLAPIRDALAQVGSGPDGRVDEATLRAFYARVAAFIETGVPGIVIRLLVSESGRFPEIAETYYRTIIEPGVARLAALLDRGSADGTLRGETIRDYPMALIAPALMAALWRLMFDAQRPLDTARFLDAFADLAIRGLAPRGDPR